jgi:hypothetical protein
VRTLTRPAFELLCGRTTLAAKHHLHFPAGLHGMLVRAMRFFVLD